MNTSFASEYKYRYACTVFICGVFINFVVEFISASPAEEEKKFLPFPVRDRACK